MTALALAPSSASPAPDWVPIDEAAKLLDRSEGGLRRLCADKLVARGLARQLPRAGSGAKCWHVAAAFDARLIRRGVEQTRSGTSIVNELLASAPLEKRQESETRVRVLLAFRAWKTRDGVCVKDDFATFKARMIAEHEWCPGKSRLYEMDAACPASDDFAGCVAALLDGRGRPRGKATCVSDGAWELFAALYLDAKQWSVKKCYDAVRARAEEEGWAWPSYTRVRQLIAERLTPSMIVLKREGRDAWSKKHLAPMEQDPNAWAAGECWEGDHSKLDFACRVLQGDKWVVTRPQLTAWLDRRSRRLMGWHISEHGNSATIRAALVSGLRDDNASRPGVVWIDNGKDFMAASLGGLTKSERRQRKGDRDRDEAACSGLLGMLGIEPHFARPYNHNGKARIERFFGLVHERFDKEFESWLGSSPGMVDRRERRSELTDVMRLPTLDDVREKMVGFAEWYNHRAEHRIDDLVDQESGQRLSPEEFYRRFLPSRAIVDRDSLKLLEQVWDKPKKVHKWGVSVTIAGRSVRYGELEPALEDLVGTNRKVYVSFDPNDTARVNVWDEQFRHICTACENGRYGGLRNDQVSVADRRIAHGARRDQLRRLKQKLDLSTASLSDAELASVKSREREVELTKERLRRDERTRDPNDLPNLRLVRTPIDGQAEAIEREEMRLAAGAEHDAGDEPEIDFARLEITRGDDDEPDLEIEFDDANTEDEAGLDGFEALSFHDTDGEEMPDVLDLIGEHRHET